MPLPPPPTPPNWRWFGALFSGRTSAGDVAVSIERVAFWLCFVQALVIWAQGRELPSSMSSFLNALVAAIVGHGLFSTVGTVTRQVVAGAPAAPPAAEDERPSSTFRSGGTTTIS